jgi:hypothetical protein
LPWYAWLFGPPEAVVGFLVTWPRFWRWVARRADHYYGPALSGPVRPPFLVTCSRCQCWKEVASSVDGKTWVCEDCRLKEGNEAWDKAQELLKYQEASERWRRDIRERVALRELGKLDKIRASDDWALSLAVERPALHPRRGQYAQSVEWGYHPPQ